MSGTRRDGDGDGLLDMFGVWALVGAVGLSVVVSRTVFFYAVSLENGDCPDSDMVLVVCGSCLCIER